ncbi:putative copper resistance-associated P-type ATPase [Aspergillus mulundensis]|uniref:Copper resistance P-type ATPase n=1 Tax=Aspergillus mulundensis TaxID=1810919 RepID=A0A3D8SKG7_9EURO|nr:Copper resistance P-type ATPase [Aspergillus mulundensis]RDW86839.1 Copper resistance P-type ATPase [Aspergillus mulundensis]
MAQTTETHRSTFFVSNVHCSSCVAYINQVLSGIPGIAGIDVSIFTHEVHVVHTQEIEPWSIVEILTHAAFEVHHVTTRNPAGAIILDLDTDTGIPHNSKYLSTSHSFSSQRDKQKHLANCDACRKEEQPTDEKSQHLLWNAQIAEPADETVSVLRSSSEKIESFHARISIGGMSCASCSNSITNEIRQLEFVDDITVTLLSNSATVTYRGPRSKVEEIVERIEDIGFEASLDEVKPVKIESCENQSLGYIAEISIGGMTCGSCSTAVTQGLNELPFVTNAVVNLMSHSAQVELENQGQAHLVVEKIEDLGYDASLVSVTQKAADPGSAVEKRTVSFRIEGMFCHHCPEKVFNSLKEIPDLEFESMLSTKYPILKVTYTPRSPSLTVRTICEKIESAHNAFKATVYRPPSVEDRSREMQRHERRRLLSRFLFVLMSAIPEFIIGIVFMSLVSKDNHIRQYLEQSMWSGSVTRIEWALFIMTTPVMFYGTDIFHVRAAKEIITLWRPGSRMPLLRRFYRFGSMNFLISAGTLVAYVSSLAILIMDAVIKTHSDTHSSTYFDTVVFLTLFILAGRYMEAYSKGRAGDAVASLGKLRPSEALLVVDFSSDHVQRINVDLLEIGDIVRVPHGASPPADGKVTGAGSYKFDESSLTGESRPVTKTAGDQVYTGSVNVGQPVEFEITAIGGSSMLDQIITVVREGQGKRAPLQRVADTLVGHFVPAITFIAVLVFVIWVSLGESGALPSDYLDVSRGGWAFWSLEFAIAVFVVACPCGLALAAPTALFVGGGLAARYGILVKGGGEAFQEASRLNAIVFDKTGTLTEGGSLQVSDHEVLITDHVQLQQIAWAVARKLEESSNHPIARAIAEFCKEQPSASITSSEIMEKSGQGMQGKFTVSVSESNGTTTRHFEAAIGNQRLYQSLSCPDQGHYYLSNTLSKYQATGRSTAILCLREIIPSESATQPPNEPFFIPAIVFAISDTIRPDAAAIISKLQQRKINVFMCTGDNETTAHAVAAMVGIPQTNVLANTLPAGKADFVRQIQTPQADAARGRQIVAFVGDGVNDSPALAAADVSIAMASGSDVAINSASFILLNSELMTILNLALLSRRVINRIKMNFGWAVIYNLCLVPVAAGVFYPIVSGHKMVMRGGEMVTVDEHWRLSPVWAALAMALSSVSVVCSSLALAVEWKSILRVWDMVKDRLAFKRGGA